MILDFYSNDSKSKSESQKSSSRTELQPVNENKPLENAPKFEEVKKPMNKRMLQSQRSIKVFSGRLSEQDLELNKRVNLFYLYKRRHFRLKTFRSKNFEKIPTPRMVFFEMLSLCVQEHVSFYQKFPAHFRKVCLFVDKHFLQKSF